MGFGFRAVLSRCLPDSRVGMKTFPAPSAVQVSGQRPARGPSRSSVNDAPIAGFPLSSTISTCTGTPGAAMLRCTVDALSAGMSISSGFDNQILSNAACTT